jgi:hypothetical protein
MRMRRFVLLALCMPVLAACGSSGSEKTPVACLAGPDAYLAALGPAPGEVRIAGSTPISGCLVPGQSGGELAQAGSAIITAATKLNDQARADPSGHATVELGYLVGAVQQGASQTSGIHADLVRRLDTAARFSPEGQLPAPFERAFGEGYAAGQQSG